MTPDLFDRLCEAGVSAIQFSVNAINAEQHKALMKLEDPFEQVKAGTETCEDPAKELEDFLQTLEIEEISEGLTRKQVEARHQT
jgi:molybdenum cofactor biosynthesis enzyme MoaA